jgi:hypothetical protein
MTLGGGARGAEVGQNAGLAARRPAPGFREAYEDGGHGPVSDPLWIRARGWALNLALAFLAYSADNPQLNQIGRRTLDAVLG